ncbi:hypothetical protein GF1_12580 [Desulfolithobacter dissulfuricans]|uniref:Uncharacterized protein n=1 Tax=Desulfolithobacter dissulfuricans TaxID=2795293 RepID=A0A915U1N2_9BACT|nr:hypothetical protein [Desulfolithobacter dissulfuricans]BCO08882.1 hypothetical protein GF1_12580 [Desulfolithobacter dissulfuricans]
MAEVDSPVEVGFAEFIARLMSEVFDSVVTSQVDQEQRYAEMYAAASLSEEEYGRQHVSDEDVAAELADLFPPHPDERERESAVYPGAPYHPPGVDRSEDPPLYEVLGLRLEEDDLKKKEDRLVLGQSAVNKVHGKVRSLLAARHLAVVKQLLSRGLPRVVVDSGRVNGKLTFHLTTSQGSTTGETGGTGLAATDIRAATAGVLPKFGSRSVFTLPRARILPGVKVLVKQADDRSPQSSQVKANVYGEVEITFKTVT